MKKTDTGIPGLFLIEPKVWPDERGCFYEAYNADTFATLGLEAVSVQTNVSRSPKGVLRGLHFQAPPYDQVKLIRCTKGRVFDVAVDIRAESPTFGKWFGIELGEDDHRMLYVPSGFAHGFSALTEGCVLTYMVGKNGYHKPSEGGVRFDDSSLDIAWPFLKTGETPLVNERDRAWPALSRETTPFTSTFDSDVGTAWERIVSS